MNWHPMGNAEGRALGVYYVLIVEFRASSYSLMNASS